MQDGCALGHGVVDGQHRRQDLVLHIDQIERVLGDVWVGRADRGHGVTLVERFVRGEHVLQDPLVGRHAFAEVDDFVGRAGQAVVRDHALDAVQRLGPRGVDAEDSGVRVRRAKQSAVEHVGQIDVGPVAGATGDLVDAVGPDRSGAHHVVGRLGLGGHRRLLLMRDG